MLTIILTIPPDYPHSKLFYPPCCLLLHLGLPVMSLFPSKNERDEKSENESHSSAI